MSPEWRKAQTSPALPSILIIWHSGAGQDLLVRAFSGYCTHQQAYEFDLRMPHERAQMLVPDSYSHSHALAPTAVQRVGLCHSSSSAASGELANETSPTELRSVSHYASRATSQGHQPPNARTLVLSLVDVSSTQSRTANLKFSLDLCQSGFCVLQDTWYHTNGLTGPRTLDVLQKLPRPEHRVAQAQSRMAPQSRMCLSQPRLHAIESYMSAKYGLGPALMHCDRQFQRPRSANFPLRPHFDSTQYTIHATRKQLSQYFYALLDGSRD